MRSTSCLKKQTVSSLLLGQQSSINSEVTLRVTWVSVTIRTATINPDAVLYEKNGFIHAIPTVVWTIYDMVWTLQIPLNTNIRIKGKSVPLQARSGPEGSRKLKFPDFVTIAQDGGRLSALRTGCFLPPGNTPGTHFCQRLSRPQGHSATGRIM